MVFDFSFCAGRRRAGHRARLGWSTPACSGRDAGGGGSAAGGAAGEPVAGRVRALVLPDHPARAGDPLVPVRAVPHPLRLDDADAARRRLHLRQQVHLRPAPAGRQHRDRRRSASRSAATSSCSACRPTRRPTTSSGWSACRATTSWCATSASTSTASCRPVTLDGILRAVRQHAARADRHRDARHRASTARSTSTSGRRYDFDDVVPAGHFFFMGDNRDNSRDSRFPEVGYRAGRQRGRQGRPHLAELEPAARADLGPHRRGDPLNSNGSPSR